MTERHTTRRLEATKEIFYPFTFGSGGAAATALGAHVGWLVNGDNQFAYAECFLPWDFKFLTSANIVFLSEATLNPMTFRIVTDFCRAQEAYAEGNNLVNFQKNTITNVVQVVDISPAMVNLGSNAPLQAKEYLGVQVSRQSGQNTNAIFLGVRIRYNTPLGEKTP